MNHYWIKDALGWCVSNMQSLRWLTQGRILGRAAREVRRPGMRVLDVGCGGGSYAIKHHLLHGSTTTLCDYDPHLLELSRQQVHSLGRPLPADFVQCSAEELPLEADTYDFIQCMEVLEHLHHPQKALAEFRRVARPGARLVISVPHPPEWFPNEGHVVEGYRKEEISRLLEAAGWEVVRVEYCMLLLSRLVIAFQHAFHIPAPVGPLLYLENLVPAAWRIHCLPYDIVVVARLAPAQ